MKMREDLLYGINLDKVNLSPYLNHFANTRGFGLPASLDNFYIRSDGPLPKVNTALNTPDNIHVADQPAAKTPYTDPKENHLAPQVPDPSAADDLFKPVPVSKAELSKLLAKKRKQDKADKDNQAAANPDLGGGDGVSGSKKKKKSYKRPVHRFVVSGKDKSDDDDDDDNDVGETHRV